MYVMGQALFSAELVRLRFKPASIRSIVLCVQGDAVLRPLLAPYPEIEVVVVKRRCQDSMADKVWPWGARVTIGATTWTGCAEPR